MNSTSTHTIPHPDHAILVRDVIQYLPHRPPMVWIDEVVLFSEKTGECRVTLKSGSLYLGTKERLRPSSFVEFIAQAYGFISVCHHIYDLDPASKPLSKAFLASIKNAKLPNDESLETIRVGDTLSITISRVRNLGSIVSFNGQVKKGDQVISEAEMKIFKEYQT